MHVGHAALGGLVLAGLSGCLLVVPVGTAGMLRMLEGERSREAMPTPNPTLPMVSTLEAPKKVVLAGNTVTPAPASPSPLWPAPVAVASSAPVWTGSRRPSPSPSPWAAF